MPKAEKRDFKIMSEHFCDLQGFLFFSTTSDVPSENDVGFFKKIFDSKIWKDKIIAENQKQSNKEKIKK